MDTNKMLRKLTDSKVKAISAYPDGKPHSVSDGGGLFLYATVNGKYWRYAYRLNGKTQRTLSIGSYPEISLAEARRRHEAARALLARGVDPSSHKQAAKAASTEITANTFECIAQTASERSKPGWSASHKERTISYLQRDIFPWIGKRHINEVTPGDVIRVVQRVEARGAGDAARRVKQYILQVYKYAVTLPASDRKRPARAIEPKHETVFVGQFKAG